MGRISLEGWRSGARRALKPTEARPLRAAFSPKGGRLTAGEVRVKRSVSHVGQIRQRSTTVDHDPDPNLPLGDVVLEIYYRVDLVLPLGDVSLEIYW